MVIIPVKEYILAASGWELPAIWVLVVLLLAWWEARTDRWVCAAAAWAMVLVGNVYFWVLLAPRDRVSVAAVGVAALVLQAMRRTGRASDALKLCAATLVLVLAAW